MNGEVRLEATRQAVWDALNDPEVLMRSIPGCEELARTSDTEFTATVVSKVGPIKARFGGKVTLSDIQVPTSYKLTGEGQGGMAGFAKADITVSLDAIEEEVTLVRYGVNANVGGKLAQLGARLIDATARKQADEFFEKFGVQVQQRRESGAVSAALAPQSDKPANRPPPMAVAAPVNVPVPAPAVAAKPAIPAESPRSAPPSVSAEPLVSLDVIKVWIGDQIKIWISDNIATVTLNRPDRRNSVSLAMWRTIPSIFAALEQDPQVRAVILTGAGEDFSAGADISEFDQVRSSEHDGTAYEVAVDACCDAIANISKPTIAVLKGYCLGGGAHLAMSCDFRYAAAKTDIGIPAARLSIIYGVKGTQKLLSLVGLVNAKKILYSAQRFDSAEALRIGFVDHVSGMRTQQEPGWWSRLFGRSPRATRSGGDPMVDARNFARLMATNAPLSVSGAKVILNGVAMGRGSLDTEYAESLIAAAVRSNDYREGRAAFAEKRPADFKGN
ncbi:MAG: enoyl-CoA hydratase-related protein [Burkholderiales bacterium]